MAKSGKSSATRKYTNKTIAKRLSRHPPQDEWFDHSLPIPELTTDNGSHFFDSGSFSLWSKAEKWAAARGVGEWEYYRTDEFEEEMANYAMFCHQYAHAMDYMANVDVLPFRGPIKPDPSNPLQNSHELTYRNQKLLEEYGLKPVPVVHLGADMSYLKRYIDEGYDYIGLGGMVGGFGLVSRSRTFDWCRECFEVVCDNKNRLPAQKLHGFGMTSFTLMRMFPWYSVDSTAWSVAGGFGNIYVPFQKKGQWDFERAPYQVKVTTDSKITRESTGQPVYNDRTPKEQKQIREWVDFLGMKWGKRNKKDEITEFGVTTRHNERRQMNLLTFEAMLATFPEYPWPLPKKAKRGFF